MTIPDSVTSIGHSVFYGCSNLIEYHMPGFTCSEVRDRAAVFGIGIDYNYNRFLAVVYCSDGVVVINDNSETSSDGGELM